MTGPGRGAGLGGGFELGGMRVAPAGSVTSPGGLATDAVVFAAVSWTANGTVSFAGADDPGGVVAPVDGVYAAVLTLDWVAPSLTDVAGGAVTVNGGQVAANYAAQISQSVAWIGQVSAGDTIGALTVTSAAAPTDVSVSLAVVLLAGT